MLQGPSGMRRDFKEGETSPLPDTILIRQKEAAVTLSYTDGKRKKNESPENREMTNYKSSSRETYSSTSVFCPGFMKVGWNFAGLTLEKNLNGFQRSRTFHLHYLVTLSTIKISAHHGESRGNWGRFFTTSPKMAKERLEERSQSLAAQVTQKIP